jgi:hypothetical protein
VIAVSTIFESAKFSDIDINDSFFDSLKKDYPGFEKWFARKSVANTPVNVLKSNGRINDFLYLKYDESESIPLTDKILDPQPRIKIGTLKISAQGIRLGEGAIGIALWRWFESSENQIYVTVFPKHKTLITLFEKFGFSIIGKKSDTGEYVMLRDKRNLDFSDPYKPFPYINPQFTQGGLLVVNEDFHDKLFPYSELKNTKQYENEILTDVAGNGITKMYISGGYEDSYQENEPVLIYRKSLAATGRGYKSVITSVATIVKKTVVKQNNETILSIDEVKKMLGNKTILNDAELKQYFAKSTVTIYQLVYNYYFGAGNNVNWRTLKDSGFWKDRYPSTFVYSNSEFSTFIKALHGSVANILP